MDLQTFLLEKQEKNLEAPKYDYHLDVYHTFMGMLPNVDFSGVEPQPDPANEFHGVRFELGDVLVTVQQDVEEGTLRPSFQGHGSTITRYGGWAPFYKNKLENWQQGEWKLVYQMAVEDACKAQQSFELLSQAPNNPVLGTHQFASRDTVLTFDVKRTAISVGASCIDGRALHLEFNVVENEDNPKLELNNLIPFLESILLQEAWVGGSYRANSFELHGMVERFVLVLTAPESVIDDAPYVSIWYDVLINSTHEKDLKLFVDKLRLFYRDLKEWATRYAAQLDCTIGDAYQAYEEHITSLPE